MLLGIGENTIKRHLQNMFDKSGTSSSKELLLKTQIPEEVRAAKEAMASIAKENGQLKSQIAQLESALARERTIADSLSRRIQSHG